MTNEELGEEIREIKDLLRSVAVTMYGKENFTAWERRREVRLLGERFDAGLPLYKLDLGWGGNELEERDLMTVEEVVAQPRNRIAAVPGVGAATLEKIEAAATDRGLTWAEVA